MSKSASIRIGVKIRPLKTGKSIIKVQNDQITVELPGEQFQRIKVNMIHDVDHTSASIYQNCKIQQLVAKFMQGYHTAVLTYGQTGSGKTFAFEGNKNQKDGIIFDAIKDIFTHRTNNSVIKCSFIQLYNERIIDMLSSQSGEQKGLRLRWQIQRQFVIEDLTETICENEQEMIKVWSMGNKNRIINNNKIHDYSSRSHSIFIITMQDTDQNQNYRSRQMFLVDLAGSERVCNPVGRLSKQAIQINKSLFHLRKVILSLQQLNQNEKQQQYIAYRDSKLTSILKRAFGGNCLTYLIACLNPSQDFLQQTLSTLQYATSAGKILNKVNINIDAKARQIFQLRQQKQKLKKQLQIATLQIQNFKSIERQEALKRASNHQYADRIIQCLGTVRELLRSNKELRAQLQKQKHDKNQIAQDLQQLQLKYKETSKNKFTPMKTGLKDFRHQITTNPRKNIVQSPQVKQVRTFVSHSVQIMPRKQRKNLIIRRKSYVVHDAKDTHSSFK